MIEILIFFVLSHAMVHLFRKTLSVGTAAWILFGVPSALFGQQKITPDEYLSRYNEMAVQQMMRFGIPASITLAQGALESGWGNSTLARQANNHFGIKCHNWNGDGFRMDAEEKNECFRKYKSVEDSYTDHSEFLRTRDRYAALFDLERTDYQGWAQGLLRAGYSTNPKYAELLISLIQRYNLDRFDQMTGKDLALTEMIPPSPALLEQVHNPSAVNRSVLYKYSKGRTLYEVNGVVFVYAGVGDTYSAIAAEYDLFEKELMKFNDVTVGGEIEPGARVYLQKKKGKAQKHIDMHTAEQGDTYWSLSQRYAVQLKKILKYNGATAGEDPVPGRYVILRKIR